jgi:cholesterol transport system auxiliary component
MIARFFKPGSFKPGSGKPRSGKSSSGKPSSAKRRASESAWSKACLAAGAFATTLLLGACGLGLFDAGPAAHLYTLDPKPNLGDNDYPKADWQLTIEEPHASAGLDTPRIAVQRTPGQLDYYAGVAWTDRVPALVQTQLITAFENSRKIVAVARDMEGVRADYTLEIEIRHFEVVTGNDGPAARVSLVAKLVKMSARLIVASHVCDETQVATGDTLDLIVHAYDGALASCLQSIVGWTLETGAAPAPAAATTAPR